MAIDWTELARDVGALYASGESGGDHLARAALAHLIGGDDEIRGAVRHYLECRPGAELVRSVLWLLKSPVAMDECMRVFRSQEPLESRRNAIELLRVIANERALGWLPEILGDDDEHVLRYGIGLVDQLVFQGYADLHDVEEYLRWADGHASRLVREQASIARRANSG